MMERILSVDAIKQVGKEVRLAGWVARVRDHGSLIFVDLRDWSGIMQLVIDESEKTNFAKAKELGNEYVIEVLGTVEKREKGLENKDIETGEVEVRVGELKIINKSKTPPFMLDGDGRDIDEQLRFKYRYLDLRRQRIKDIVKKKHHFLLAIRNWMSEHGFTEVITPLLTSTSPEGARDFYIPSRVHQGKFFVLPQAPQQFKQLLMVGGVDKYFQIAPCARDEDPRADRHAGVFYQIDIEMSFPTIDKIFDTCEQLIKDTYEAVAPNKKLAQFPFPRMKYVEAVERYGTDKPDVRFGLELQDVTHVVKDKTDFRIFQEAEIVKLVNAQGCGEWSRKEIDEMEAYVKGRGGKGLAYAKVMGGQLEGGISKFIPAEVQKELISEVKANENDLLFFAADKRQEANRILSEVRLKLGDLLGLRDDNVLSFAWVMDFPFYEKTPEGKIDFGHNPFSMPKGGIEAFDTDDPLTIESNQYDLTLNGYEILSGSIRNHDPEILLKAFQIVGYGIDEIKRKFGALYNAFQYGAPPHGGWAIGFDRMFMVFIDEPNIRDVYAFPLNSSGMDVMMNAPSELPEKELEILGLKYLDRGSAVVDEITGLLESNNVEFKLLEHQEVRTSEEAAKVRNTQVSNGAKAMVLKSKEYNGKYTMVVVPADKQVDLGKVEAILGEKFEVASGEEVERYTGVKMGGVPPFGRLLKMDLYFDKSMWSKTESAFNCGRRDRSIIMQTKDLIKLAQPNKLSESSDFVS